MRNPAALSDAVPADAVGYVVTVADDGHPHVVPTNPALSEGAVVVTGVGTRTRGNVTAGAVVTVLWSPVDVDGYTLIVDGSGEIRDDTLVVRPTRAVLHRPRAGPHPGRENAITDGCVSDCIELTLE